MKVHLLALMVVAFGMCDGKEQAAPIGAVRVHTSIQNATLFVDAVERAPLADAMEVQLTPGPHTLEARRDGAVVGRVEVQARSALIYDVDLVETVAPSTPAPAPTPVPPPQDQPGTEGTLSAEQIQRVVRENGGAIRACYEDHAQDFAGTIRILVTLAIQPDGSVQSVNATGDEDTETALRTCIEARVATWTFPPSGGPTTTSFPLVFTGAGEPPPPLQGPETPSRSDIVSAMQAIAPAVAACAGEDHGVATVRLVFEPSTGRVRSAELSGGTWSPAVSSCIVRAARQARVPPFSSEFSVNYPFRL